MKTVNGEKLFKIGMGTWGIGGAYNIRNKPGGIPDIPGINPVNVIKKAIDAGVNVFDTSLMYGLAEERLGKVIGNCRDEVFVASKCGLLKDGSRNFTKKNINDSIVKSLKHLGVEYLDLYQVTFTENDCKHIEGTAEALYELKETGLTRYIGLSISSVDQGIASLNLPVIDTLQFTLNLLDVSVLDLLKLCAEKSVFTIIKSPFNKGVLSGLAGGKSFGSNDSRRDYLTQHNLSLRLNAAKNIMEYAKIKEADLKTCAAKFLFSLLDIGTILFGIRTENHVDWLINMYRDKRFNDDQLSLLVKGSKKYYSDIANTFSN